MKKLLWVILILVVAVWIGTTVQRDPGIIVIRAAGWRIDLPLWVGAVGMFLFLLAWHYLAKIYRGLFYAGHWVEDFAVHHRKNKAKHLTQLGFVELAEGDWSSAEKHFLSAAKESEVPLLNYLSAAKAAQEMGDAKRRDKYLKLAHDSSKGADLAIGLTQAKLQYQHGQYEQALATAKHLLTLAPHHSHVLKLLKNIYYQLKDWQQLLNLMPKLKKYKVVTQEEAQHLEKELYGYLMQQSLKQGHEITSLWHQMPKVLHTDPDLAYPYAAYLCQGNEADTAENILRQSLKRHWSEKCIQLYGLIQATHPKKLIDQAESWLKLHQDSPHLFLALGRLCMQMQLWGKAQRYLEASLKLSPLPEAYAQLGLLLENIDQNPLSAQYFRQGLIQGMPKQASLEQDLKSSVMLASLSNPEKK